MVAKAGENKSVYFKTDELVILCEDFLKTSIQPNSVDLIVTSPPYNLDINYNSSDDQIPYEKYLQFSKDWIAKAYDVSKDDGRFCLNIPLDKNKGGQKSMCADLTSIAKEVGWNYHSTIIWNEGNISRRTAWGSFMSASAPYVIAPVEVILLLYKKSWKKGKRGVSDITKKEFMDWTNGLWTFSGESKRRVGHPAPFPVELPRRCVKLFSYVGDTILDPFVGSGTTLIACALANRKGIGVDIDKDYCKLAKRRLLEEAKMDQLNLEGGSGLKDDLMKGR